MILASGVAHPVHVHHARLAPGRNPPYFKHESIRWRLGEPGVPVQAELFDAH
jgi:hypothetical protein